MSDLIQMIRTGERFTDHMLKEGIRSFLIAGPVGLYSIERGDGRVWLRPGHYDCEHALWTGRSGKQAQAIRVLGHYNDRIYIHPANWPFQLEGCIAPGRRLLPEGVGPSRPAMADIFDEQGGFEIEKRCFLEVIGSH